MKRFLSIMMAAVLMASCPAPVAAAALYPAEKAGSSIGKDGYICFRSKTESYDGGSRSYFSWKKCPSKDCTVLCNGISTKEDGVMTIKEYTLTARPYETVYGISITILDHGLCVKKSGTITEYPDGRRTGTHITRTADYFGSDTVFV